MYLRQVTGKVPHYLPQSWWLIFWQVWLIVGTHKNVQLRSSAGTYIKFIKICSISQECCFILNENITRYTQSFSNIVKRYLSTKCQGYRTVNNVIWNASIEELKTTFIISIVRKQRLNYDKQFRGWKVLTYKCNLTILAVPLPTNSV